MSQGKLRLHNLASNAFFYIVFIFKAFRLKQMTYDGIGGLLKSLKSPKLNETEVETYKKRLASLVGLLNKLEKTVERSEMSAIDIDLDLLSHKLSSILYDGDFDEDEVDDPIMGSGEREDETALYLEDILMQCKWCHIPKKDSMRESKYELTRTMLSSQEFIMNFVHEIVWPEIFKRMDQKKKRKQLMVDLKNLTSEERQMVESLGNDCVESILCSNSSFL